MGVEFSVFRGNQGGFEIRRDTVEGNRVSFFQIQFGQQLLVGGIDTGDRLGSEGLQGSNLGQIPGEGEKHPYRGSRKQTDQSGSQNDRSDS